MSMSENHDQVNDPGRPVVLPRSILPGRKEHFQTFPPPTAPPRSSSSGSTGPRHSKADITSPMQARQNRSRPAHFAAPASAAPGHPIVVRAPSDPNLSVASSRASVLLAYPVDDRSMLDVTERILLDVTERVTMAPSHALATSQADALGHHGQRMAESQVILHPSVAPTAVGASQRAHCLISVLIAVAVLALVAVAFAVGFIVGERQDIVPQGGPAAASVTTAAARTVEMISVVQQ